MKQPSVTARKPVAPRSAASNGAALPPVKRPAATAQPVPPPVPPPAAGARTRNRAGATRSAEEDNWDQRLGFLMHDVSRLRRSVFDEFMRPLGVTRSQWWVLAYLSRHDGMIQSDLANVLDLGKAALGGLIDRLEASAFIERRADDNDRRVKRIFLSSSGTHMVKEMHIRSHEMSERILDGLPTAERQRLAEMLSTVKRNLLSIRGEG